MIDFDAIARSNPGLVDELYAKYRRDPGSVDPEWRLVFAGYEFGRGAAPLPAMSGPATGPAAQALPGVFYMVHAYRQYGHLAANLDPLGHAPRTYDKLQLSDFGISEADLDKVTATAGFRGFSQATIRELRDALAETYCGSLGVEFVFITQTERREWLLDQMEPVRNRPSVDTERRREILRQLIEAENFEHFLHTKYRGAKRFSLEGGEALIPLLHTLITAASADGVDELVFGMPHRGRLNVLAHVMRKPYELILAEFEGVDLPEHLQGAGDVKYHKGYSHDLVDALGHKLHLSLSYNPSHLEAIDPVVLGMVRAKQARRGDRERRRVVPVLMHGDAAFAGQGMVYETLALSNLKGFDVGGTVHIIINNQIGFTTSPEEGRSTRYASDVARSLRAPVFHVNADDPEAVLHAAQLAFAYRQKFGADVFIDLICYRRHGHNELDDPTFTQPRMYREIQEHPSVVTLYGRQLIAEGVVDEAWITQTTRAHRETLEQALAYARAHHPHEEDVAFRGLWAGMGPATDSAAVTAVDGDTLRRIADALVRVPESFTPHPRLLKHFEDMRAAIYAGEGLMWAAGELLAYGSLLLEGTPVRLTGQDSARGTFSHRHAVLYDYETGEPYTPLNHIDSQQALLEVINSPLSEVAVLGYEWGLASADPHRLVLWEAQFGDFANGAQVVIDQFLAASEVKWSRQTGLVLLLPHGYEGQGPEHSSARLERFLQLCAQGNMQVVNLTTPAQFFHALRRQVRRPFRKPLVVMSPKSLLRHRACVSSLAELSESGFRTVIDDEAIEPRHVRRVVLLTGKLYYTLDEARREHGIDDIALVRVEQLYPFPADEIAAALARYPAAADVVWAQEEPRNQGAWGFMLEHLVPLLDGRPLRYVGRAESASPAVGSYQRHVAQERAIVEQALLFSELRAEPRQAAG